MRVLIAKHLPDQNNVPVDDVDPQIIDMIKTSGTLVVAGEVLEANESGLVNSFPESTKKFPYTNSIRQWNHLASSNISLTLDGEFVNYALGDPVVVTKLNGEVNLEFAQRFEKAKNAKLPNRPYLLGIVLDPVEKAKVGLPEGNAEEDVSGRQAGGGMGETLASIFDAPKFVIFDEMNLARVEYYLADILSAMELGNHSGCTETGGIRLELGPKDEEVVSWPDDLFILGTANMDETTYSFSPKVLDRCFYIRYSGKDIDLRKKQSDEIEIIKKIVDSFKRNRPYFVRSNCFKQLKDDNQSFGWPSSSEDENSLSLDEMDSIPGALAAALATKGFVILGGVSGAGKTRIARIFAESVLEEQRKGGTDIDLEVIKKVMTNGEPKYLEYKVKERFAFRNPLILSVRPDWRDGSSVIGYYNAITNERKETPLSEMLRIINNKCCKNKIRGDMQYNDNGSGLISKIADVVLKLLDKINAADSKVTFAHRAYHEISAFIYNYLLILGCNISEYVEYINEAGREDKELSSNFLTVQKALRQALSWAVVMKILPKFHGSKESVENQLFELGKTLIDDQSIGGYMGDLGIEQVYVEGDSRAIRDIKMLLNELRENDYAIYA